MQGELATVKGIVDLSPQEALDEAHSILWAQGYMVTDRTETTLTAVRRSSQDAAEDSKLALTVAAMPQPQGGVRITIGGNDREGLQEQRDQWLEWSERLPRKQAEKPYPDTSPAETEEVLAEARGVDGQVELLADRVRIRRRGLLAKGKGGDKEIPFDHLRFVEFKSGFTGGHIQFVLVGHEAQRGWRRNTEYEVQFKAQQAAEFEAIKREVEQRVGADARGPEQTTTAPTEGRGRSDKPRPQGREPASKEPLAKASGGTKDLIVFGDRVEIRRSLSLPREAESMDLAQVETVTLTRGPDRTNYAEVSIQGAGGRTLAIGYLASNEAKRIKELIERQAAEARRIRADSPEPSYQAAPETAPVEEPTPQPTEERRFGGAADVPELIRKLAELRDAGVISDDEFEAKKTDLLNRQPHPKLKRRRRRT